MGNKLARDDKRDKAIAERFRKGIQPRSFVILVEWRREPRVLLARRYISQESDGDSQPAGGQQAGVEAALVCGDDRGDNGESQAEAVGGDDAFAGQSGEGLEQLVQLTGWDHRAC